MFQHIFGATMVTCVLFTNHNHYLHIGTGNGPLGCRNICILNSINMCSMWYCLYIIIVSRLISFCILHVLNLVYDLSMFYIQLYENSTLYFSENTLTLVCTLNNSLMESPVSV